MPRHAGLRYDCAASLPAIKSASLRDRVVWLTFAGRDLQLATHSGKADRHGKSRIVVAETGFTFLSASSMELIAVGLRARLARHVVARAALHEVWLSGVAEQNECRPVVDGAGIARDLPSAF
jgi:hypothetical protein